MIDVLLVMIKK